MNITKSEMQAEQSSKDSAKNAEKIQELEYVCRGAYHWSLDPYKNEDSQHLFRYEHALKQILSFKPKTVIDLGCGDGYFTHQLSRHIPSTLGVDFSEKALSLGKIKSRKLNLICADAKELPVRSNSIDLVCCIDMLEHNPLEKIPFVVEEVHRVLVMNGIFVISVPTDNEPLSDKHYSHFSPEKLSGYLNLFVQCSTRGLWKNKTGVLGYISRFVANRHYTLPVIGKLIGIDLYRKLYSLCEPEKAIHLFGVYRK